MRRHIFFLLFVSYFFLFLVPHVLPYRFGSFNSYASPRSRNVCIGVEVIFSSNLVTRKEELKMAMIFLYPQCYR